MFTVQVHQSPTDVERPDSRKSRNASCMYEYCNHENITLIPPGCPASWRSRTSDIHFAFAGTVAFDELMRQISGAQA
jgi:hypothetical protein